jgi:hypothetical protein
MSSEKSFPPSPVEGMMHELVEAKAELNKVEAARNTTMREWADLRSRLEKDGTQIGVMRAYERETVALNELNARFVACQDDVHKIMRRMREGHQRWATENMMRRATARPQAA